jgi:SPP1 family predicted phage head-tail adaptor
MGGIPQNEMTVLHTTWAQIDVLSGRDALTADQFMSQTNYRVTVRYFADVDAACRIWFNGRTFQITSVNNPDQRTKMLVLLAVEINDSKEQYAAPAVP